MESFNGKFRDELLNGEPFLGMENARCVIDRWRLDYNHRRPHSALDYQTPAVFAANCVLEASATLHPLEHRTTTDPTLYHSESYTIWGQVTQLCGGFHSWTSQDIAMHQTNYVLSVIIALLIGWLVDPAALAAQTSVETQESEKLAAKRKEMKKRRRGIIYNNDGNGIFAAGANTPDGFLAQRMKAVPGSTVGSVFYNTGATTMFTHQTKVGEVYGKYSPRHGANIRALAKLNTDTLSLVTQFCHQNALEVFFTYRINDIHDCFLDWERSTWKRKHPEYLMGKLGDWEKYLESDPRRRWAALDFEIREVRDYLIAIIDDVMARYDVDGIEIDYLRNPLFFRPNRSLKPATRDQVGILTRFQRRIRDLAYKHGNRRGRPMLIATRVPVSRRMGRYVGIDIEQWLKDDLLDVLTIGVGCMPFTNPIRDLIKLGHAHDVPVYPTIAGSGRTGQQSVEHWRGAAANMYHAGADGMVFFNLFPKKPKHPLFMQLGSSRKLGRMNKVFALDNQAIGDGGINHTIIKPAIPLTLNSSKPSCQLTLPVGDDVAGVAKEGRLDSAVLRIRFKRLAGKAADIIEVRLNGNVVKSAAEDSGLVTYTTDPSQYRHGDNAIVLRLRETAKPIMATVSAVELHVKYK